MGFFFVDYEQIIVKPTRLMIFVNFFVVLIAGLPFKNLLLSYQDGVHLIISLLTRGFRVLDCVTEFLQVVDNRWWICFHSHCVAWQLILLIDSASTLLCHS